jgi:hypothetical protein
MTCHYLFKLGRRCLRVDGQPVLRQVHGRAAAVINTYAGILFQSYGFYNLHAGVKCQRAPALQGPWNVATQPLASLNAILATLTKGGQVNALDNPGQYVAQSAANGIFPTIYVSTVPAELIMTRGTPAYEPIAATSLLDVTTRTTTSSLTPPPVSPTSSSRDAGSRRRRRKRGRGRTCPTTSCRRRSLRFR